VTIDFRDSEFEVDCRIGFVPATRCVDCGEEHPESVEFSIRHVAEGDEAPAEQRDQYVPTLRVAMSKLSAARAVALWVRMFSEEEPELLARAMDDIAAIETTRRQE
jgi:hypothetical protein